MHEPPLEHVLLPAHVRAPETTSLIEMRTRALKQLPAFPKESFPAVAADATPIGIDRVAFRLLIDPRLGPAFRFANGGCVQSSFESFFLRFRSIRAKSARVGVPMPEAFASVVRNSS